MVRMTAVLFLIMMLAACATPPAQPGANCYALNTGNDPAVGATLAARCSQDAAATYDAAQRSTAVIVESTAVAAANATSTVEAAGTATMAAETSTAESLSVKSTEIALDALVVSNAKTAAWADVLLAAEITRTWQETLNLEMMRADKQKMLDNMRAREAMWNNIIFPALILVVSLVVIGLLAFGVVYLWRSKRPVINVTINGRDVPMILDAQRGGYKLLPRREMDEILALPAPGSTAVAPEPLPALPHGHVLVAGPTDSGKTTALLAILQHRRDVIVLDPHGAPGKWGHAQMKGAGRNFEEIGTFMRWMAEELNRRAQALADDATITFPEMTVATDEMPAIADALGRDAAYNHWKEWVREGRKFGLFFVFSSQSLQVKPLGLEGEKDILRNFAAAIVLGEEATERYPDVASGMERPAVLRTKQGVAPVVIPHMTAASPTPPGNGHVAAPVINLPKPRSQAEQDGRMLDEVISECYSLNDVGRVLMEQDPEDKETRPSGQMLRERVRPALAWRINYLRCQDSSRILTGR